MPYESLKQERWAHTPNGEKALGGKEKVAEWDAATKGKKLPEKKALGGEIRPLRSPTEDIRPESPYKVLKEEENHFVVSHVRNPDAAFRVAKFGLGHKTLNHIRSQLVQHLDVGGPVEDNPYDQGGMSPEQAQANRDFITSRPGVFMRSLGNAAKQVVGADGVETDPAKLDPAGTPAPAKAAGADDYSDAGTHSGQAPAASMYDQHGPGFEDVQGGSSSKMAVPADPAAAPAQKPAGYGGPDQSKKVDEYTRQMNESDRARAEQLGQLGDAQAKVHQGYLDQLAATKAQFEDERQRTQHELDSTIADIKNAKIDPNRHWGTGGTAVLNKTMAGIGMIIAGIGTNNGGGNNMALQVINKAIDRDIDAQKTDLANKNNLVSIYFRKLGNINDAETRAKLDLHANVQAQLEMALAKAKGPMAQAELGKALAQNGMNGLQMVDHLATTRMQRAMQGAEIAKAQQEMALNQQKLDLMRSFLKPGTGPGQSSDGSLDGATFQQMRSISDAGIPGVPKNVDERYAKADDGRFYPVSNGKSSVDAINKAVTEQKPYVDLIDKARTSLQRLGPIDRITPNMLASPDLRRTLTQLQAVQLQNPKALEGLGRYTPEEARRIEESFSNWRTDPRAAAAALEEMSQRSHETLYETYKQHFISPRPASFHAPVTVHRANE